MLTLFSQGFVLDASPLMKLPITSLLSSDRLSGSFTVEAGHQSLEEREVNGTVSQLRYRSEGSRYPFLLFLDGIVG
jgi:21S rRNA (GM2251-2'-O)-methyltransferase